MEEWPLYSAGSYVLELSLRKKDAAPFAVLCLGAHSDDIEIGCGGTLLHVTRTIPQVSFHWVVFSACGARSEEAIRAAELFAAGCEKNLLVKDYRDGFLPYRGGEIKELFENLKKQVNPDLIFTHWSGDAHQDHRLISELTWNTFRNHMILEYEVPKYDGDIGRPHLFVPLDTQLAEQKVNNLFDAFESQRAKPWFDRNLFLGLMRIRGMESNSPSGYAEAFHCRKLVVQ